MRLLCVIGIFLFLACEVDQEIKVESENPSMSLQIEKVYELGTPSDEYAFSYIGDISIDSNGNAYVLDVMNHTVVQVDKAGNITGRIGEQGSGPGEFNMPISLDISDSDTLYVFDRPNRRLSVFSIEETAVEFIRATSLTSTDKAAIPQEIWVGGDRLIASYHRGYSSQDLDEEKYLYVHLVESDGSPGQEMFRAESRDRLIRTRGNNFSVAYMPFGREPVIRATQDGVYHARTGSQLHLEGYDWNGERYLLVENDLYQPPATTAEEFDRMTSRFGIELDRYNKEEIDQIPDTWPSFGAYELDDQGNLWVGMNEENHFDSSLFWVINRSGDKLAEGRIEDVHVHLENVDNNYLYGVRLSESGAHSFVKYVAYWQETQVE